jgi:hypothetical protein
MGATMTRQEAVQAIRRKILEMVDDEHSMCRIAAEKGIFCHGFRQHTDEELRERYDWLLRNKPDMSREELEDLANRWQLARQVVNQVPVSCDAQTIERDTCRGWDTFDDDALARFYLELLGVQVEIVAE